MAFHGSHLFCVLVLVAIGAFAQIIDDDMMDNSLSPAMEAESAKNIKPIIDWVKISESPPNKIVQPVGTTIELECEATGSPPPFIVWVRGNNPQMAMQSNNFEMNHVSESLPSSIVRVRSRLIIDHVAPGDRAYTCVAKSGGKIVHSTTVVIGSMSGGALGALLKTEKISEVGFTVHDNSLADGLRKARIVLYFNAIFQLMGSDVFLPCRAAGRPYPDVYWMDNEDRVIGGPNGNNGSGRLRVLPSGELLINDLKWSDMGSYRCVAQSAISKDTVSTFVYPVLNQN